MIEILAEQLRQETPVNPKKKKQAATSAVPPHYKNRLNNKKFNPLHHTRLKKTLESLPLVEILSMSFSFISFIFHSTSCQLLGQFHPSQICPSLAGWFATPMKVRALSIVRIFLLRLTLPFSPPLPALSHAQIPYHIRRFRNLKNG